MKNLSLALNGVLFIFVIVLFVMVNNLKKSINGEEGSGGNGAKVGTTKPLRVAYINADSITSNYLVEKDFNAEIQAKENAFQEEYNTKMKKFQDEYQEYMQKKQAGNISDIDDERVKKDLQAKQNELDGMQQQKQDLVKYVQDKTLAVRSKIVKYINAYNKKANFDYVLYYINIDGQVLYANDSLDITKPILAGLNQMYKDSVQKAGPTH